MRACAARGAGLSHKRQSLLCRFRCRSIPALRFGTLRAATIPHAFPLSWDYGSSTVKKAISVCQVNSVFAAAVVSRARSCSALSPPSASAIVAP